MHILHSVIFLQWSQMIFFVLSKLTDTITIGYFTGDIVNGSKVLLEIILNSNKSWKVLIRGKTVNPGKIGLDELYNLDSVFEIVRQMKYCRAVPEVVKSKENLAYLKDFISKVGDENSSEVCFRSNSCTIFLELKICMLWFLYDWLIILLFLKSV